MEAIRIQMLGGLQVHRGDTAKAAVLTPAAQDLFAFLLLHRERPQSRDHLLGVFWGDSDQRRARNCLNSAVWRLRRALGAAAGVVTSTPADLGIDTAQVEWLDVEELGAALHSITRRPFHTWSSAEADRISSALALYRGGLLEGCYSDWALRERERVRCLYLGGLDQLMRYHGYHADYEEAEAVALRVLSLDSIREETHRFLMRLYEETGQRTKALRQYRACAEALAHSLGVAPMQETRELYNRLAQRFAAARPGPTPQGGFQESLLLLRRALDRFDQASEQLQRAVQAVERHTPPA